MTDQDTPQGANDNGRSATIAYALRQRYGDDAQIVARVQLDVADHESRPLWEAILAQLSD